MRVLILVLGTLFTILLIIKLISGKKYEAYFMGLDSSEYPLKSLYGIGYAWENGRLFALKEKKRDELVGQAVLLYEKQYAEYYANLTWAQMLTFVHLSLTIGFLLAGIMNTSLFAFAGILFGAVLGYYFLTKMKELLVSRRDECAIELAEVVSSMALLINAGMMLKEAWETIAYSKEGTIYELMQGACDDMKNGMSEIEAIHRFSNLSNSPDIKKFASSLIQGIEMGNQDLSAFLNAQSTELWSMKKQLMLQKGEAAASKLLIPTTLIFVGIIILVIAAAVATLI